MITHRISLCQFTLLTISLLLSCSTLNADETIYDEANVPEYTLPDPLVMENGSQVSEAATWQNEQRPRLLELFKTHVYGHCPQELPEANVEVVEAGTKALEGKAIRKQLTLTLSRSGKSLPIAVLCYLPAASSKPVPAFLALNFRGNHTIQDDPGIIVNQATGRPRGSSSSRWPVEMIVGRGYALVTAYYGDIDPDNDDGFKNGIHGLYRDSDRPPAADQWGSIAGWAFGLSRIMDYLQQDSQFDSKRIVVLGHSRLGKTALWTGASDERFAAVISNNSGCGGAALSRRRFGESVKRINTSFTHWFCDNFVQYNDNENALPVDQHTLIALIAPRPVYIASAVEDRWADPHGEFLSVQHAATVYQLLGAKGFAAEQMPPLNEPIAGVMSYHIRSGKHDVTDFDWECYLDFADQQLQ